MSLKYDVIISGAGPSGSLLAFLLSSINIKTLVLEKKSFPRPKICAGGLQHRAARLLPFSIDPVVEKIIYGVYFSYRSKHIFNKTYHVPLVYMLDRAKFDQFLAEKARQAGSDYHYEYPATDYEVSNNYITVKTPRQVFTSRLLVGADGVRGMVHRKLVSNKQLFKIIGYEFELGRNKVNGHLDLNRNIAIDFGGVKGGYAWVFPKNKNLSIGIGGPHYDARHIKKYFKKFLSQYILFKDIVSDVKIYGQCIPVRKADTPICDYRVLAIGDAAGLGECVYRRRAIQLF
ncbi:MAG: geranylgeranyl reductase family protein [Actinomycetota bacterium]|nr:geranylgeranyl reductase family protein [Actinomycetota bacterium]